ncbi:unnamed protein product, partial [Peronospora belbahrii]
MDIDEMSA